MKSLSVPATVGVIVAINEADHFVADGSFVMKPVITGFLLGLSLYGLAFVNTELAIVVGIVLLIDTFLVHAPALLHIWSVLT